MPPSAECHRLEFVLQRPLDVDYASFADLSSACQTWLANQNVEFSVCASGVISAGTTACRLDGNLAAVPGSRSLSITLVPSNRGDSSAGRYAGMLYASDTLRPAAFRTVADNGSAQVDRLACR